MVVTRPLLALACSVLSMLANMNITSMPTTFPMDTKSQLGRIDVRSADVCGDTIDDVTASHTVMLLLQWFTEMFIPLRSVFLWGSFWVISVITWNHYMSYLFATFLWLDTAVAAAATMVCHAFPVPVAYCSECQLLVAFYSTALTHTIVAGVFPPPLAPTAICICGLAMSVGGLLYAGTCSIQSAALAATIGIALGVLRVVFYYDAVMPSTPPPSSERTPLAEVHTE
jgi:hypothetical protein